MVTHLGKFMSRLSLSLGRCPNNVLAGVSWNGSNHGVEAASTNRDVRTFPFSLSLSLFLLSERGCALQLASGPQEHEG